MLLRLPEYKIVAVCNARAGRGTPHANMARDAALILEQSGQPFRLYDCGETDELPNLAAAIRDERPNVLVFSSGDGGRNLVLNPVIQAYRQRPEMHFPFLLTLPAGRTNTVANSFGITGHPCRVASRFAKAIREGRPIQTTTCHTLTVNGRHGFLFGVGLPLGLVQAFEHRPRRDVWSDARFLFDIAWRAVRGISHAASELDGFSGPFEAAVVLGDDEDDVDTGPYQPVTSIMAGTVKEIGCRCRGLPFANNLGTDFMLRSSSLRPDEMALLLPLLYTGRGLPKTLDASASGASILYLAPRVSTLDGEILEPTMKHRIETGVPLEIIIPRKIVPGC
ncbi:MAG: diacylglycerol kinase family protein [Patescibacteria group bacterium]|nr:diacylglycerol kinase family protein [Patescibacteria group bacterium]